MSKEPEKMDCPECGGELTMEKKSLNVTRGTILYECKKCLNEEEAKL